MLQVTGLSDELKKDSITDRTICSKILKSLFLLKLLDRYFTVIISKDVSNVCRSLSGEEIKYIKTVSQFKLRISYVISN